MGAALRTVKTGETSAEKPGVLNPGIFCLKYSRLINSQWQWHILRIICFWEPSINQQEIRFDCIMSRKRKDNSFSNCNLEYAIRSALIISRLDTPTPNLGSGYCVITKPLNTLPWVLTEDDTQEAGMESALTETLTLISLNDCAVVGARATGNTSLRPCAWRDLSPRAHTNKQANLF